MTTRPMDDRETAALMKILKACPAWEMFAVVDALKDVLPGRMEMKLATAQALVRASFSDIATDTARLCCDVWDVPEDKLTVQTRKQNYVNARFAYMWVLYTNSTWTLQKIARSLYPAVKSHCTVLHGVRKVNDYIVYDEPFREQLYLVVSTLAAAGNGRPQDEFLKIAGDKFKRIPSIEEQNRQTESKLRFTIGV